MWSGLGTIRTARFMFCQMPRKDDSMSIAALIPGIDVIPQRKSIPHISLSTTDQCGEQAAQGGARSSPTVPMRSIERASLLATNDDAVYRAISCSECLVLRIEVIQRPVDCQISQHDDLLDAQHHAALRPIYKGREVTGHDTR